MPDYPTDEPATLERQGGDRPNVAHDAQFTDAMQALHSEQPAVWRPPNAEELAKLEHWAEETPGVPPLESPHIAVIDGYQDPTPGYAGPLAVLVYSHMDGGEGVATVALLDLADPRDGDDVAMTACDTCGFTDVRRDGTACPNCDDGIMRGDQ